jgi:hypothetical protein
MLSLSLLDIEMDSHISRSLKIQLADALYSLVHTMISRCNIWTHNIKIITITL